MIDQVERKIEEFEKYKRDLYYKNKEADLIAWGLTTKTQGKKEVPIIVTDEEYEALKEAAKGTDIIVSGKTKMAQILNVLAIIIAVCGLIAGAAMYFLGEGLSFVTLSLCWGGSLALCCLFLGIAEILNLITRMMNDK